jgi:alpha-galactosidase
VHLDKDGSPMLNAVGYVEEGRISVDTAHTFERIRRAGPGIAARYYMHRNFFINDPDAFCLSRQVIAEMTPQKTRLTFPEAQVSIALTAVSGGMFEIGDDLPTLGAEPERLALVKNQEILRMAKLGRASRPIDLMTYDPQDQQPSIFLLREDRRQSILTVFNWTEAPRSHKLAFAALNLAAGRPYRAYDVFTSQTVELAKDSIAIANQPPHSVRMIKIVDESAAASAPAVTPNVPKDANVGDPIVLSATADPAGVPALSWVWHFGDGTQERGAHVTHTYTGAGDYQVLLDVEGIDGLTAHASAPVHVTGTIQSPFPLSRSRRFKE